MVSLARRGFFKGSFKASEVPLRPPWAVPEHEFIHKCNRCGDCITACPEQIIKTGEGGFPYVDFNISACTFCADCVQACDHDAFNTPVESHSAWSLNLFINNSSCLAYKNVECRVCSEACSENVIKFSPRLGGVALPVITDDLCTGCGACVGSCPGRAITLKEVAYAGS